MAKKQEAPVQTSSGEIPGLEGVAQRVSIPRVKIVQAASREAKDGVAKPGVMIHSVSGEIVDSLAIVVLRIQDGRVYFDERTSDVACKSYDGKTPASFVATPQSSACASCPKAQFVGRTKPPCATTTTVTALDVRDAELPQPFLLDMKRRACRAAHEMAAFFMTRSAAPYTYTCQLAPSKVKGDYYVPSFTAFARCDPADKYAELFERYAVRSETQDSAIDDDDGIPF